MSKKKKITIGIIIVVILLILYCYVSYDHVTCEYILPPD